MKTNINHISIKSRLLKLLLVMLVIITSCKKLVEIPAPTTFINGVNVYNNDVTAIATVTGIYTSMSSSITDGIASLSYYPSLSADELSLYSGVTDPLRIAVYTNTLSAGTATGTGYVYWGYLYQMIYRSNDALAGLATSTKLTPGVKQQLTGEAKFLRAFFYFYLINLYGDAPLITGTDYVANSRVARDPKEKIWQQIISDLKDAEGLLSSNYLDGTLLKTTNDRIRPTKWVAAALLARTYLYHGEFANAVSEATNIISNQSTFSLPATSAVFLRTSKEAIWQLQPTGINFNTPDGAAFLLPATGPDPYSYAVYLNNDLVNAFESNDQRKASWVNAVSVNGVTYNYPYKYKQGFDPNVTSISSFTEFEIVFRLAEQYLIRAEAEAQLNDVVNSQKDINTIRSRAGLPNTSASDRVSLVAAILKERRAELFTEWGHRWLDLKRSGTIDAVMTAAAPGKGSVWKSFQQLYPLPPSDIAINNLLTQNPGY